MSVSEGDGSGGGRLGGTARVAVIAVLVLLDVVVLAGQVWPEGAPPFARAVNIVFLVAALAAFVAVALRRL